jgi:O-antigen ligase
MYLLSGFWSEDLAQFWIRIRVKLPFLALPIALLAIPEFGKKEWHRYLYFFFLWMLVVSLYTLASNLPNLSTFAEAYGRGQVFPTPINHIRFSLLLVLAVLAGTYLLQEKFVMRFRWEKGILLFGILFIIVFLHILAVRSGLMCLYLLAFFLWVRYVAKRKNFFRGLLLLAGVVLLVFLAFRSIPTLKNKLAYTLWSLEQLDKEEWVRDASDPKRIASMKAGWSLGLEHPFAGVGVGDVQREVDQYFVRHYPALAGSGALPHNQYLFVFAGLGVGGLLLFIWILTYPLWFRQNHSDFFNASFHLILLSSFLVEMTLETQYGTAIYLLFLLPCQRFLLEGTLTGEKREEENSEV